MLGADAPASQRPGQPGKLEGKAMSIELRGRSYLSLREARWIACLKIAREFGWIPEYERKDPEVTGLPYPIDDIPDHNARALAEALYRVIRAIETDSLSLSEPLDELVKTAGVSYLRAVADVAYAGTFYVD
jgi:hypothetical protein